MNTTEPLRNAASDADTATITLDDLLDQWEIAREQGEEVSLEELCRDVPHLLATLREHVAKLLDIEPRLYLQNEGFRQTTQLIDADLNASFGDLRLHATGGLGAVYAAEDQRLHRNVALKFLRKKWLSDRHSQFQFETEAEITARLEHPGVVPVYGLGRSSDGRAFYAMRFINGRTLDEAIASWHGRASERGHDLRDRDFRSLLTHFISLCKTIAYAHNRGIVHCDIKPANVMLGRYGETLVVDWGLATEVRGRSNRFKVPDHDTLKPIRKQQGSHGAGGTPAYMSPEQHAKNSAVHAEEPADSLQPATDIYSLGVTLYKLLTGQIPVDAPTLSELKQRVIRADYARPSHIRRHVPPPLEAICLKAMAVEPHKRYETALQLADDVERYMTDDAVEAYEEPMGRRLARWGRRHRHAVAVAAVALVTVTGLATMTSALVAYSAQREKIAHEAAEIALRESWESQARTLAEALRYQIERRLDAIEIAAEDEQLRRAVADLALVNLDELEGIDSPKARYEYVSGRDAARPNLNEILETKRQRWNDYRGFANATWFVILRNGRQAARSPLRDGPNDYVESIGQYYGYRQYFRGQGPEPRISDLKWRNPPSPIAVSFLAAPHESTNGKVALVTFTTPVMNPENRDEVVGVLGIALPVVELTDLDDLLQGSDSRAEAETHLTIAYLRPDFYRDVSGQGLILQHEAFRARGGVAGLDFEPFRLTPKTLKIIEEQRSDVVIPDYQDPLAERSPSFRGDWYAVVVPVLAEGYEDRDATCIDTGWHVILQCRPGDS